MPPFVLPGDEVAEEENNSGQAGTPTTRTMFDLDWQNGLVQDIDYPGDDEFIPENDIYYDEHGNAINMSEYYFGGAIFVPSGYDGSDTNGSIPEDIPVSNGRLVALSLFAFLFLVGILGNTLVISTAARFGGMRKVTYLYLVNLSVANLVYLLVCLPTVTISYFLVDWPFGQLFCQVENYIMSVSMSVSVLTIVATGLDRYMAIVYPVRSKTYRTTAKTLAAIATIWVLSLASMAPRIQLFHVNPFYHIIGMTKLCVRGLSSRTRQVDTVLCFLFLYLFPQVVLVICHVRIGQTIWQRGRSVRDERPYRGGPFCIRERRRIAKIVIAITVVFGICWMPVHLYHLVEDFDYGNILFGEVLDRGTVALFFSFGANALNPVIYCVISGTYRKHFTNSLLCRKGTLVMTTTVTENEEQSYRRPAPTLQPRPALILSSPPRARNELSRRLLEQQPDAFSPSPLSVDELTGIRVSDIDQISTSSLVKSVLRSPTSVIQDVNIISLIKSMSPPLILRNLDMPNEQHHHDKSFTLTSKDISCSSEKRATGEQSIVSAYASKTPKEQESLLLKLDPTDNDSDSDLETAGEKSPTRSNIRANLRVYTSQQGKPQPQPQRAESQRRNPHIRIKSFHQLSSPNQNSHDSSSKTFVSTDYVDHCPSRLAAHANVSNSNLRHKKQNVIEVKTALSVSRDNSNSDHTALSVSRDNSNSDHTALSVSRDNSNSDHTALSVSRDNSNSDHSQVQPSDKTKSNAFQHNETCANLTIANLQSTDNAYESKTLSIIDNVDAKKHLHISKDKCS